MKTACKLCCPYINRLPIIQSVDYRWAINIGAQTQLVTKDDLSPSEGVLRFVEWKEEPSKRQDSALVACPVSVSQVEFCFHFLQAPA